jgi:Flp pilus assembly pilin Flp
MKTLKRFIIDEGGQDFAEYALILGAIAVVALAVIAAYKDELTNAFNKAISALQAASS